MGCPGVRGVSVACVAAQGQVPKHKWGRPTTAPPRRRPTHHRLQHSLRQSTRPHHCYANPGLDQLAALLPCRAQNLSELWCWWLGIITLPQRTPVLHARGQQVGFQQHGRAVTSSPHRRCRRPMHVQFQPTPALAQPPPLAQAAPLPQHRRPSTHLPLRLQDPQLWPRRVPHCLPAAQERQRLRASVSAVTAAAAAISCCSSPRSASRTSTSGALAAAAITSCTKEPLLPLPPASRCGAAAAGSAHCVSCPQQHQTRQPLSSVSFQLYRESCTHTHPNAAGRLQPASCYLLLLLVRLQSQVR